MVERQTIIAGNWKMHKTAKDTKEYLEALKPLVKDSTTKTYLAVPYTALSNAVTWSQNSSICIGAQNMHDQDEGAFTGEISALMLKEVGAYFVLLGHSERRHIFQEQNDFIAKKVKQALSHSLLPILCIGETLQERESGQTEEVLKKQLTLCLEGVHSGSIIIAYEPVWAIGTGVVASPKQAQDAHAYCRSVLASLLDESMAMQIPILYGGSVKPENAKELMEQKDVDGALVGGASLNASSFAKIVNYLHN